MFDLQREIAGGIAKRVSGELMHAEYRRIRQVDPRHLDAWTVTAHSEHVVLEQRPRIVASLMGDRDSWQPEPLGWRVESLGHGARSGRRKGAADSSAPFPEKPSDAPALEGRFHALDCADWALWFVEGRVPVGTADADSRQLRLRR